MTRIRIKDLISSEFRKSFLAFGIIFASFFCSYELAQFLRLKTNVETIVLEHATSLVERAVLSNDFFRVQLDLDRFATTLNQDRNISVYFAAKVNDRLIGESAKTGEIHLIPPIKKTTVRDLPSGSRIELASSIYIDSLVMSFVLSLALGLFIICAFYVLMMRKLRASSQSIADPLHSQVELIKNAAREIQEKKPRSALRTQSEISEITDLNLAFNCLISEIYFLEEDVRTKSADQARVEMADKVAHDIVSPLAALRAQLSKADLDSSVQASISKSLGRIQEIVFSMKSSTRKTIEPKKAEMPIAAETKVENLVLLINDIVFEKQVKFSERPDVELSFDSRSGIALFLNLNAALFQRSLSNLVDNAFEAIEGESGQVLIRAEKIGEKIIVSVSDTGTGIESEIIPKLMTKGATFGKPNGTGLGLFTANEFAKSSGGEIRIETQVGHGTSVQLHLLASEHPEYFLTSIRIQENCTLVAVDDDHTIKSIWKMKLEEFEARLGIKFQFQFFSDPDEFSQWFKAEGWKNTDTYCYFDQELRGFDVTGIDLIEKFNLKNSSVVVSSHASQADFQMSCTQKKIRYLPKDLLFQTPIENDLTGFFVWQYNNHLS